MGSTTRVFPKLFLAPASSTAAIYKRLELAQLVFAGNRPLAAERARKVGASLWSRPDAAYGLGALAARRSWEEIAALYDARFSSPSMLCAHNPDLAIFVAPALQARRRGAEAEPLLTCAEQKLMREQRRPYFARQCSRAIVHFARANIQALRGDNRGAASELDRQ